MRTLQPEDQDPEGWAGNNPANQKSTRSAVETNQQAHYIRGSEKCVPSFPYESCQQLEVKGSIVKYGLHHGVDG